MSIDRLIRYRIEYRTYDRDLFLFLDDSPTPNPAPMPIERMIVTRKIINQNMRGFNPNSRVWSAAVA